MKNDEWMTLAEASERVIGCPSRSTLWRFCTKGEKTPRGIVRLEHMRMGKGIRVTIAQLEAFGKACAAARLPKPRKRPRVRLNSRLLDAESRLEAAGY